jgi:hypothetical protein
MTRTSQVRAKTTQQLLAAVLTELEAQLADVTRCREKLMDGAFDPELSAAATRIAQVIIAVHAEQRQERKMEQRQVEKLTVSAFLARIRQLDAHEREHVARELDRMMRGGRIFGP